MKKTIQLITFLVFSHTLVWGQNNFFSSSVFENKVVFNPSQSGMGDGLRLNGVFRSPMNNSQPGLAKEYAASADVPISETAGIGLILTRQNIGILNQTLFNFSYAYGMAFKSGMKLRFGIGAGFRNTRVVENSNAGGQIIGDPGDPTVLAYNSVPPSFFSSFGLTLYTDKLEVQLVAPNLTAKMQNKTLQTLDYVMMQGGLGYKLSMGGGKLLGPGSYAKIYAGAIMYKETGMLIQGGFQVNANNLLSANFIYSTNGIMTVGVGVPIESTAQINLNYSVGGLYSNAIYGGSGLAEIHFVYRFKKRS
jgi:type IX secretion system PorP/SprF family membrane protein